MVVGLRTEVRQASKVRPTASWARRCCGRRVRSSAKYRVPFVMDKTLLANHHKLQQTTLSPILRFLFSTEALFPFTVHIANLDFGVRVGKTHVAFGWNACWLRFYMTFVLNHSPSFGLGDEVISVAWVFRLFQSHTTAEAGFISRIGFLRLCPSIVGTKRWKPRRRVADRGLLLP